MLTRGSWRIESFVRAPFSFGSPLRRMNERLTAEDQPTYTQGSCFIGLPSKGLYNWLPLDDQDRSERRESSELRRRWTGATRKERSDWAWRGPTTWWASTRRYSPTIKATGINHLRWTLTQSDVYTLVAPWVCWVIPLCVEMKLKGALLTDCIQPPTKH